MAGSVLITGANGSLGIHAVDRILREHPNSTAILTVRNLSDADANTKRLQETIARYPGAKASIHSLDLSNLTAVHEFAEKVAQDIANEVHPPLSAIVANAYYWNLVADPEITGDGYDKTFQVGHIAHPGKNGLEKYPPTIPDDLELLAKPKAGANKMGLGFQRYANTKLVTVSWMYALNRHLQKGANLSKITAVAINPGNLVDSRALRVNTPGMLPLLQKFVLRPLMPLMRLRDPTMRQASAAGVDVAKLAVDQEYAGARGYYTLLKEDESSPESKDEKKQEVLWVHSARWAGINKENTSLAAAIV
ncbi:hypothetical protein DL764_003323 [Monosporascus ibericus]|uniref:Ketoreductase (KR) domain-containing protein n=1 Tax=Monosporascus ibericus TaxID=155417 RepID=A0A4Q4TK92_9PEZI|nr:hypothetical protein DL764_003323 [Monosporascus ibericus]